MFNNGSSSVRFYPRLNVSKNSTGTVRFYHSTNEGYSYQWCFLKKIDGVNIENCYKYSPTTWKHQSALSGMLYNTICLNFGSKDLRFIGKEDIENVYRNEFLGHVRDEIKKKTASEFEPSKDLVRILKMRRFKVSQKRLAEIRKEVIEQVFAELMDKRGEQVVKRLMLKDAASQIESINLGDI